jgi:hypothetical protein
MATHATITFSQPGVQPPVYVTSSLSGWTPLEMDVAHDKTPSGDLVFTKTFTNVHEGSYQYKVRLGQDNWILDESKETATDDQGIRNNVIHVKPASSETLQSPTPDAPASQPATASIAPSHDPASKRFDNRKDSTMDQDSFSTASVDAGHDAAKAKSDPPAEPDMLNSANVPLLVVDKVESSPAHEQDASGPPDAQKIAHEAGAADALPDKVNIVPEPEHHVELGTDDEQASPLFRHESFQDNQTPAPSSMGTIDEDSTFSSADHTSSGDGMDTPSEVEEGDEGDELNLMPLLSHETALRPENNELANEPLFGHEAGPENHDADEAPLFPHESSLPDDTAVTTDSDGGDELDRFPLLAHEGRSSGFNGSMIAAKNGHWGGGERQPFDDDEEHDNHPEADGGDAPLLPHERESEVSDHISSHAAKDYAPSPEKHPDFGHETDGARTFFGRPGRYDLFRSQKNSSLPHRMPPSDAEDEDLNDPSLERFPTNRDQIFQRVASIGAELPEDEATHGHHPCSPQPSVFSQACSSVDLVPVKSYTSLASVPEAEDSDEEEDNHDLDSLPSPIYLGRKKSLRLSNRPTGFSRDPHATPVINASKQLGDIMQDTHESSEDEEKNSGNKAENIDRNDGAGDASNPLGILHEAISMPSENVTSSTTSDLKASTEAAPPESELRHRRGPAEEASQASDAPDTTAKEATAPNNDVANAATSPALSQQQAEKHDTISLKHLFGAAFGDRKRASASALVLGGVLAAYYFRAAKP